MPIRATRPRKNEGLRQFIVPIMQNPTMRFLKCNQEWEPLADLIYGPDRLYTDKFFLESVRREGFARLAELKTLWLELREPILQAAAEHMPDREVWATRFDKQRVELFSERF